MSLMLTCHDLSYAVLSYAVLTCLDLVTLEGSLVAKAPMALIRAKPISTALLPHERPSLPVPNCVCV